MRLPKDILSGTYTKPRIFLCEPDKQRICQLETTNTQGTFKFNSYSELSFEVARTYNDLLTGETKVNPFYDKIEGARLIEVENFAYFEIQDPSLLSDGIKECKNITAYSLEYTLSQKYLEDFYTTNGRDEWYGSLEDLWQVKKNDYNTVPSIVLYNPDDTDASILHIILEKVYGWSIGHVDKSLWTLHRDFDIDRNSIYDFIINEVCAKFNCYAVFDTINNIINLYAESLTSKFLGDGNTTEFTIDPPFEQINTVSVGSYKTTQWKYNATTGVLTLEEPPKNGEMVEVIDGAMKQWETDVFISFANLSQSIEVSYSFEDLKTVLAVTYGDGGTIREVNLGLPYLVDLSYYYTPEWMGQELYDAYTLYLQKTNQYQADFTKNTQKRVELSGYQNYEENRLSLHYSLVQSVTSATIGTYYVRGGTAPDYYYTEVSLPSDFKAGEKYYSMNTANLNEDKVANLYEVLKQYFNNIEDWGKNLDELVRDFEFMESPTLSEFKTELTNASTFDEKDNTILNFLGAMWNEVGREPLQKLYLDAYKKVQVTYMSMDADENGEGGGNWSQPDHSNYWYYYPVTLMIKSIEDAIKKRTEIIDDYQKQIDELETEVSNTSNDLLIENNFTKDQMIRLSAFLREDELQLDDIVETDIDSLEVIYDTKRDAMETGRIELQKLCQPQLQFSMTMANIYALPEFEPIVNQFQLGNVIKVGLRDDYIKQSRLMRVNINFDDFSDFSCEFGDLTNLKTQSDIHADLLCQAVTAGQSVATNASYWTKGSDKANATDLRLQEGLLDAVTQIKSTDGTQGVVLDKYGLKLQKEIGNGEIDPEQVWMVNNQIVFTDDNFKTSRSALGKVTVDGQTYYGIISEIVLSGYIEGSTMKGGTIQIGEQDDGTYAFEVDTDGNVKMLGGLVEFSKDVNSLTGSVDNLEEQITTATTNLQNQIKAIDAKNRYEVKTVVSGPTTITSENDQAIMMCKVYSWGTDITDTLAPELFQWRRTSTTTRTFIADGNSNTYRIGIRYPLGAIYIDGVQCKQNEYTYNALTGELVILNVPKKDTVIEIIDINDLSWINMHAHMKSITITHEDIYENANFTCDVNLPE